MIASPVQEKASKHVGRGDRSYSGHLRVETRHTRDVEMFPLRFPTLQEWWMRSVKEEGGLCSRLAYNNTVVLRLLCLQLLPLAV
jgi:hypothetical protein